MTLNVEEVVVGANWWAVSDPKHSQKENNILDLHSGGKP